jgi:hypothetical protein
LNGEAVRQKSDAYVAVAVEVPVIVVLAVEVAVAVVDDVCVPAIKRLA